MVFAWFEELEEAEFVLLQLDFSHLNIRRKADHVRHDVIVVTEIVAFFVAFRQVFLDVLIGVAPWLDRPEREHMRLDAEIEIQVLAAELGQSRPERPADYLDLGLGRAVFVEQRFD